MLPLGRSATAWPISSCHLFFSTPHFHKSAHQNPLSSVHVLLPSIWICSLSYAFYLLLFEPTGRWELLQPIMIVHSKGPSLDLQFLRRQVCKLIVMIDSKLSNVTVSTCSNAYSLELKMCAFAIWGWFEAPEAFYVYCAALYHIWDEISQRPLKSVLPSSCSVPPISAIRALNQLKVDFLWNVSMQNKSENVFSFFVFSSKATHFFASWSHR